MSKILIFLSLILLVSCDGQVSKCYSLPLEHKVQNMRGYVGIEVFDYDGNLVYDFNLYQAQFIGSHSFEDNDYKDVKPKLRILKCHKGKLYEKEQGDIYVPTSQECIEIKKVDEVK